MPSMDDTRIIQGLFAQLVMRNRNLVKHDTRQTSTNLLHASGVDRMLLVATSGSDPNDLMNRSQRTNAPQKHAKVCMIQATFSALSAASAHANLPEPAQTPHAAWTALAASCAWLSRRSKQNSSHACHGFPLSRLCFLELDCGGLGLFFSCCRRCAKGGHKTLLLPPTLQTPIHHHCQRLLLAQLSCKRELFMKLSYCIQFRVSPVLPWCLKHTACRLPMPSRDRQIAHVHN